MDPFEDEPHPRFHTVDGFQATLNTLNKGGKWEQLRGFLIAPQPFDFVGCGFVLPLYFQI